MKNILKSILALSAVFAVVSCNVDAIGTIYDHTDNNNGVSFTQTTLADTELGAAVTSLTLTVGRTVGDAAQTVSIATTLPEGISVPGSVSFAAGQYSADLVLDLSNMQVGVAYKGAVSLATEADYSDFAISSVNVNLQKAYTWELFGKGTYHYNEECFFSGDDPGLEIYKAEGFQVYKITHWGYNVDFVFTVKSDNSTVVHDQFTGYTHSTYGPCYVDDLNHYAGSTNYPYGKWDAASKTFTFCLIYYDATGPWGYGFESFEMD